MTFKPENYNSLSAYLVVDGAQKLADQLITVFDAQELRRYEFPNGKIAHMELRIDDSVLMLADGNEKYPGTPAILHLYVPDVHSTFTKAIENGCTKVSAPTEREGDPDIRGTFTDCAGNFWSVSTQKPH